MGPFAATPQDRMRLDLDIGVIHDPGDRGILVKLGLEAGIERVQGNPVPAARAQRFHVFGQNAAATSPAGTPRSAAARAVAIPVAASPSNTTMPVGTISNRSWNRSAVS